MSIVIVGIGDEDFGLMKILDGDDQRLYSTDERRFASRDIVQFVKFNDFKTKPMHVLAAETLAEIPREVVNYFKSRGITPASRSTSETPSESSSKMNDEVETKDEEAAQVSDIAKQLEVMKSEFLEQVTKITTDVDEFEVYKIITEEKIPSRDLSYFQEIVKKGTRGVNVFSLAKPTNVDAIDARTRRSIIASARPVDSSMTRGVKASESLSAPVVHLAGAGDVDDSEFAAVGKPLAATLGPPSPEVRAKLAKTFSVEHLTPPRSPNMQTIQEDMERPRPVSPSVALNLDLTKPMISLMRGDSRGRIMAEGLPEATSADALAHTMNSH
jgi:hypothetical protein